MKKLIISIVLLLIAIVTMAYLYFSNLNISQDRTDTGLQAAIANTALIFSFENEKEVTAILKEQPLFEEILGAEKYKQLSSIKKNLLALPKINQLTAQHNLYIGFVAGSNQDIDFICFTELSNQESIPPALRSLKAHGILAQTTGQLSRLTMPDSNVFYLGITNKLAIISTSEKQTRAMLASQSGKKNEAFMDYILASKRFTKNSLAQLYINFERLPPLLKNFIPSSLNAELGLFNKQNAFAALTYNFNKDKVLLTGTTLNNDPHNYYQLFSGMQPQKISISNILPDHTTSYTIFAVDNYPDWKKNLNTWFLNHKEDKKISELLNRINSKYHLNPDELFPRYFKNQFITFQLSTAERIGAIALSNGDKMTQLLLDLSSDYEEEIKLFKEPGLLYAYFGQPFIGYKQPYYIIIDNYMVFANHASTLQSFLNRYKNNQLLINTPKYLNAINQLPGNSSIICYVDHLNADHNSFTYQLSGDNGKFQTNVLINKQPEILQKDSLAL